MKLLSTSFRKHPMIFNIIGGIISTSICNYIEPLYNIIHTELKHVDLQGRIPFTIIFFIVGVLITLLIEYLTLNHVKLSYGLNKSNLKSHKKIFDNGDLEKQKYNYKRKLMDKRDRLIFVHHKRNEINQVWHNIDNILSPLSSMKSRLENFYPPEMTPPVFYSDFAEKDNMSIGQKYAKITHHCLNQLLRERESKDFIIHNDQSIKSLLQKCIGDLSCLWHVLNGQFSLTDKISSLVYEVKYKNYMEIRQASKFLYKNAGLLDKHKNELDEEFYKHIKHTK